MYALSELKWIRSGLIVNKGVHELPVESYMSSQLRVISFLFTVNVLDIVP
jgi:hypothetical protein